MLITTVPPQRVLRLLEIVQVNLLLVDAEGVRAVAIINPVVVIVPDSHHRGGVSQLPIELIAEGVVEPVPTTQCRNKRDMIREEAVGTLEDGEVLYLIQDAPLLPE